MKCAPTSSQEFQFSATWEAVPSLSRGSFSTWNVAAQTSQTSAEGREQKPRRSASTSRPYRASPSCQRAKVEASLFLDGANYCTADHAGRCRRSSEGVCPKRALKSAAKRPKCQKPNKDAISETLVVPGSLLRSALRTWCNRRTLKYRIGERPKH